MAWLTRLANVLRPRRLSRDLDREIAFHLAERADALEAGGMPPDVALREARRRFGNVTSLKERTRDADVLGWLESLGADLRYAARALRASPAFTLVAVLSLGLGVGANTAIFSLVNAVMLRSLPVARPEQIVQLTMSEAGAELTNPINAAGAELTNPIWEQLRDRQDALAGAFVFSEQSFNLAAGGEARRVPGYWVSGDFFTTLGVRPALGRLLARGDDVRGCPPVAVVSHGFWERELGADPAAVGRTMTIDGHPFVVAGVAQPGFFGVDVGRAIQVFAPLCAEAIVRGKDSGLDNGSYWFLSAMGRLPEGATAEQATARLAALSPAIFAATLPRDWPKAAQAEYLRYRLGARPAPNGLSGVRARYRLALLVLMVVVGAVLLVACANVANLLLARAAARQREMAVRRALGAGQARIVRQLLTESLLLAVLGAAVGVLFARWGSALLVGLLSARGNAVWLDLSLDGRVLAFTLAVAAATGVLFGLAPAWRSARVDPQLALKAGGRGVIEGRSRFAAGKALVVGQVALSLVLVMAAGLLLGTFRNLARMDPGFRAEGVLLVSTDLSRARGTSERKLALRGELLEALRAVPGVRSASASELTPVSGMGWNGGIAVDGYVPTGPRDAIAWFNAVSDRYFATIGATLVAGRDFDARDRVGAPKVAIINETMARKFFGGASPLGKSFSVRYGDNAEPPVEVVGVVRDSKYRSLREEPAPAAYFPIGQSEQLGPALSYELRTDGPTGALAPAVKAAVAAVDPGITLDFRTLSGQVAESLARERLLATLSGFFGGLALLLAVVGLYGTMAYGVARRRNEIGIRIALGAARARVMRMVLGEATRLVAAGLAIGALLALAATRLVASFLYGVTPTDPVTLALSVAALAAVALAAGTLPAWRAARVAPMDALREE